MPHSFENALYGQKYWETYRLIIEFRCFKQTHFHITKLCSLYLQIFVEKMGHSKELCKFKLGMPPLW